MSIGIRSVVVVSSLLAAHASTADAQPPGYVEAQPSVTPLARRSPLATTERWGGGVRLTGLSGIGALPGVNFGAELAGHVRRDEVFAELAMGRWKPRETYVVSQTPEYVELGLDVWTLRGGWASMKMPLRGWLLVEVGELAGVRGMQEAVARMVMWEVPKERRWRAAGAGFGVAWPMNDHARLVGTVEIAVPVDRGHVMLDRGDEVQPDPMAARYAVGLEVGWR